MCLGLATLYSFVFLRYTVFGEGASLDGLAKKISALSRPIGFFNAFRMILFTILLKLLQKNKHDRQNFLIAKIRREHFLSLTEMMYDVKMKFKYFMCCMWLHQIAASTR